jgi:two-component system, response regulator
MSEQHVILLVEDNPSDEELTLRALKRSQIGNPVVIARDGAAALDYLFFRGRYANRNPHEAPQVVLLDLNLPKIGGLDVLRAIRNDERTKRLPVVILTSSKEDQDLVESYDLGANSYIVKPVDFSQFAESVRQLGLYWLVLNQPAPNTP